MGGTGGRLRRRLPWGRLGFTWWLAGRARVRLAARRDLDAEKLRQRGETDLRVLGKPLENLLAQEIGRAHV